MIQSSCALDGASCSLICGSARCRTVRSMTYIRQASASTDRPTQSAVVARRSPCAVTAASGVVIVWSLRPAVVGVARVDDRSAGNSSVPGSAAVLVQDNQSHWSDSPAVEGENVSSLNGSPVVPLRRPANGSDRLRSGALIAATAAQVVVPIIGPLLGQRPVGEVSKDTPSIVTPPDWAFGVWGPIFAGSAATAVVQALPGQRSEPASREAGWWLAAAAAGNALWEWVAQSGRYRATPPILWGIVAAAGAAHHVLQRSDRSAASRLAGAGNGLLLGWTSLAASINTADVLLDLLRIDPDSRRGRALSLGLIAAAAAGVTGIVAASHRAAASVAATTTWGLSTLAATTARTPVRVTGWAAVSMVAGGLLARIARTRRVLDLLG